ncbi:hypothetical protein D3C78_1783410 [compost metagenome]
MARRFLVHQEFGDNARDLAAIGKHAACDRSHDAAGAAAIDQPEAVVGDRAAERTAGFHVNRVASGL